jgi:hypothetical protein
MDLYKASLSTDGSILSTQHLDSFNYVAANASGLNDNNNFFLVLQSNTISDPKKTPGCTFAAYSNNQKTNLNSNLRGMPIGIFAKQDGNLLIIGNSQKFNSRANAIYSLSISSNGDIIK